MSCVYKIRLDGRPGKGIAETTLAMENEGKHRTRKVKNLIKWTREILRWPSLCMTLAGAPTCTKRWRPASRVDETMGRRDDTVTHTHFERDETRYLYEPSRNAARLCKHLIPGTRGHSITPKITLKQTFCEPWKELSASRGVRGPTEAYKKHTRIKKRSTMRYDVAK